MCGIRRHIEVPLTPSDSASRGDFTLIKMTGEKQRVITIKSLTSRSRVSRTWFKGPG